MRDLCHPEIDCWRRRDLEFQWGVMTGYLPTEEDRHTLGIFAVRFQAPAFRVFATAGDGWDHVSVSLPNRCPTWPEMDRLKRLFFEPDEVAMQLHVAEAEHISVHPYCLHIWRPHGVDLPLPPSIMVGPPVDLGIKGVVGMEKRA